VKLIADSAFDKDLGISTLPDNITSLIFPDDSECMEIGSFAFARTNFLSLRLPTKMQTIKNYGFGLCLNLTDVIFNEQLSELDPLSFTNDFALRNVYINNDQNIIQIGTADMTGNPFFGTNDQLKIFAPIVLKYDYENARSWNQLGLNFNFVR
jgi:hypothetical protein